MKKYPKYKDSGIDWIGEIPQGWAITSIQKVAKGNQYSLTGGPFGF